MPLGSIQEIIARVDAAIEQNRILRNLRRIILRFNRLRLSDAAASATYYLILSIFPLLIFLVSLASSFNPGIWQHTTELLQNEALVPAPIMEYVRSLIQEIRSGPTTPVISIGILGVLWSAGRAFSGIFLSFGDIYGEPILRNGLLRRVLGSVFLVIFGVLTIVILTVFSFGDSIFGSISRWLRITFVVRVEVSLLSSLVSFLVLTVLLSLAFFFASRRKGKYRYALSGALISTILLFVLSRFIVMAFYLSGKATVIYGSLTTIILFLLWIYFVCFFVFCGAFVHRELVILAVERKQLPASVLSGDLKNEIDLPLKEVQE